MPPRAKYTQEQIADAAFRIVREVGMDALTARSLAKELGTSTAPIFTVFASIEAVQNQVVEKAKALYRTYLQAGLCQTPPFKSAGLQFIRFAQEEPELFKLLFMNGDKPVDMTHFMPGNDENALLVLDSVMRSHGLDEENARRLYNHLSVYTYGIAVLYAQKCCMFTMEDVNRMMTDVFTALLRNGAAESHEEGSHELHD